MLENKIIYQTIRVSGERVIGRHMFCIINVQLRVYPRRSGEHISMPLKIH